MKDIHDIIVILLYKFTEIEDPVDFRDKHLDFCLNAGLLGKVLVAKEGINGSLSGSKEQIESYKKYLTSIPEFSDIRFKEETSTFHPFKKMIVRVKKQIIRLDEELDMTRRGKYITAGELLDLYNSGEEFIILDTRNNYESDVGKFKNALTPDIDNFREFPKALEDLKDKKDKKIITYCTGGIRCEKATALMVKEGFSDVYQLREGIINFCQEYPDTVWEGKCFVFDQRLISDVDPDNEIISVCSVCSEITDRYINCKNIECDQLVLLCVKCGEEYNDCCSDSCEVKYNNYLKAKSIQNQGYKSRDSIKHL